MLQGGLAARAPGKHLRQPFEQLPLPCGHLVRMKLAPRRDRLHAVPLAQRLERYPCLELRREPPSLPGHLGASSSALESTLTTCPKNRDHLIGRTLTCPQERYHILMLVPAPVEGREGRASSGTRATA